MVGIPPRRPLETWRTLKCSLGCPVLDAFVGGGVRCGFITELVGEATSGKSQICLQALLHTNLSLRASSILLCTEGSDSTLERLAGLSKALASMKDPRTQSSDPDKLVSSVFLERVSGDGSELLDCLHRLRALLQRLSGTSSPVRLLVLDSIAAPTREAPGNDYAARAAQLLTIACLLRRYADEFEIAVLVSNQVLDIVANDAPSSQPSPLQRAATGGRPLVTGGREVTPALGLAWASAINTRLFLSKDVDGAGRVSRTMHIVWAPDLPPRECEFQVTRHGTFGLLPKQKCEQTQGLIRACNDRSLKLSI